ncbi:hypothetical protein ASD81_07900 [Nocardioides sp. Root614]|nr:hypothetical protein ASD81_07900 [Nocardioides sp. Root614]KRA93407.1 hypothetical protein ASD84_08165 [Nocardioides sp. Root682]
MHPAALVPGVLALLPRYASLEDPVAELRAACLAAVGRLGPRIRVVASGGSGGRVGAALVRAAGSLVVESDETGLLVVANGSGRRTEKAPGHFDERAEGFDAALRADLGSADPGLAAELWADVAALDALAGRTLVEADVLYDDLPFGVQYWVAVWGDAAD